MCGRYNLNSDDNKLAKLFTTLPADLPTNSNQQAFEIFVTGDDIRPTNLITVAIYGNEQIDYMPMRWGLIPSWAKDISIGQKTINARAETLTERPVFRAASSISEPPYQRPGF